VTVEFYGGKLDGQVFTDPATVKKYARQAQLGQLFEFDRETPKRTAPSTPAPAVGLPLLTPSLPCCSSSATSGTAPVPSSGMCSPVLTPI